LPRLAYLLWQMPDLKLCTRQDVLDVFNNDLAMLNKLAKGGTTTFDQTLLDKPILTASAEYDMAAGNKFSTTYNADPTTYAMGIRTIVAALAAWWFWQWNSGGMAMPEGVKTQCDWARGQLDKMEAGKRGAGTNKPGTPRVSSYRAVDTTGGGVFPRMTLNSWRRMP